MKKTLLKVVISGLVIAGLSQAFIFIKTSAEERGDKFFSIRIIDKHNNYFEIK